MASRVPNIAKGRVVHLATLPLANDAIVAVPLKTAGLPTDEQMCDAASLAAIFALGASENATMGRKTLTGVAVTVDNTANEARVTSNNPVWTAAQMAPAGGAVSRLAYCYVPDTTAPSDATAVPLVILDANVTPDSNAYEYQHGAAGWFGATEPA